ncbi:hypothetical protein RI367_007743 [Sorochytrium milnesiophthora]
MGGTRLEVFKFGIYVFAPVAIMYFTGVPEFIEREVWPLRAKWLRTRDPLQAPPRSTEDIKVFMDDLRHRQQQQQQQPQADQRE